MRFLKFPLSPPPPRANISYDSSIRMYVDSNPLCTEL